MFARIYQDKFLTRIGIGFLQGMIIYAIINVTEHHTFPEPFDVYFFTSTILAAGFVPLLLIQGIGNIRKTTLSLWAMFATIIIMCLGYYSVYRQITPIQTVFPPTLVLPDPALVISMIIALFITQSLILSSEADHQFRAHYHTYFDLSWKLALQTILAYTFTGIFWLLLLLGDALFSIIHLNFFNTLITKSWFACPATTLATAVALHVTDINVRMIEGVRSMLLSLFSWLLSPFTAIISLFLVCLVFTGLTPLWNTHAACALLLATTLVFILLINASFQNGQQVHLLGRFQFITMQTACIILIPIISLATYALYLRVNQYGLSTSRIIAAYITCILFFYAIGYALSAFVTHSDLSLIKRWNFLTALFIIVVFLAAFSPFADPARLMVNNQINRLKTGVVSPEKFDYLSVRIQGMRYGYIALAELQSSWKGTSANLLNTRINDAFTKANSLTHPSPFNVTKDVKKQIILHTPNASIPDTFINQAWKFTDKSIYLPACLTTTDTCDGWMVKNAQQQTVIILRNWENFIAFTQDGTGIWHAIGYWNIPGTCVRQVMDEVKKSGVKLVAPQPQMQDLEVAGFKLPFISNITCK